MEVSLRVPKLEEWYYAQLGRLYETVPVRKDGWSVVMGCPVWGMEFATEFVNWCVPSILEPESRTALAGCCRLVICCPAADRLPLLRSLKAFDGVVELQFIEIPDDVIELTRQNPQIKLFLLGTVHKLILQIARRLGAGFHFLMPDHVHGAGFYAGMRQLSDRYEAIAQCGISAEREAAQAEMAKFRGADAMLSIPPPVLGDIAWNWLHPHHRANVMATASTARPGFESVPNRMPRTQLMLWRTRDKLVAHSCRPNPTWLSPRLVERYPVDFQRPATLDCEVPFLAPEGVYLTKAEDGMAAIELTPADAKPVDAARVPFATFAPKALNEARYSPTYLALLRGRTELPLSATDNPAATDEEIERDAGRVVDMLHDALASTALQLMQRIGSAPEALIAA